MQGEGRRGESGERRVGGGSPWSGATSFYPRGGSDWFYDYFRIKRRLTLNRARRSRARKAGGRGARRLGATPSVFLMGMGPPFPPAERGGGKRTNGPGERGGPPSKNRQGPPSKGRQRNARSRQASRRRVSRVCVGGVVVGSRRGMHQEVSMSRDARQTDSALQRLITSNASREP